MKSEKIRLSEEIMRGTMGEVIKKKREERDHEGGRVRGHSDCEGHLSHIVIDPLSLSFTGRQDKAPSKCLLLKHHLHMLQNLISPIMGHYSSAQRKSERLNIA